MSAEPLSQQMTATAPKVVVLFRATGDAPILKQSKFKIGGQEKFAKVIDFLRKQLHRDTVFCYINTAFSPNPDELINDLFENFGIDGKLVVNYACTVAWGYGLRIASQISPMTHTIWVVASCDVSCSDVKLGGGLTYALRLPYYTTQTVNNFFAEESELL